HVTGVQTCALPIYLTVAATKDALVMVEGGADEATEADVIDALEFAHQEGQAVIALIERLRAAVGRPKRAFTVPTLDPKIAKRVSEIVDADIAKACVVKEKHARYDAYAAVKKALVATISAELGADYAANEKLISNEFENRKAEV